MTSERADAAAKAAAAKEREKAAKKEPEKVEKLLDLDTMELEVGYGLVRLVDAAKGGDLLDRISLIRRQIAIDLGIIVPPVRIRDNMQLGANDYVVKIKGQAVGQGRSLSRAVPGDGQRRDAAARSPAATPPPSRRSGCPPTGSPSRSAPGRDAELHRRRSHRRAGDASDRSDQVARPRTAHPPGGQEPDRATSRRACPALVEEVIPDAGQAGRIAEGHAEPAPRARAGARSGDDPGNARRLLRRAPRTWTC